MYFAVAYNTASITNDEFDDLINVYPNPSNGKLFIELDHPISETLSIEIIGVIDKIVDEFLYKPYYH